MNQHQQNVVSKAAAIAANLSSIHLFQNTALAYMKQHSTYAKVKELSATSHLAEMQKLASFPKYEDSFNGIRKLMDSLKLNLPKSATMILSEHENRLYNKADYITALTAMNMKFSKNLSPEIKGLVDCIQIQSEIVDELAVAFAKIEGLELYKTRERLNELTRKIPDFIAKSFNDQPELASAEISDKSDLILAELMEIKEQFISKSTISNIQSFENRAAEFVLEKRFQVYLAKRLHEIGASETLAIWIGAIAKFGLFVVLGYIVNKSLDQCESHSLQLIGPKKEIQQEPLSQKNQFHDNK